MTYFIVLVAGFFGLGIASYIYKKKKSGHTLMCPLRAKCDGVIHSEYAKFFGIPIEILGMGYYSAVVLTYALLVITPVIMEQYVAVIFISTVLTVIAFLFSCYLVFIQGFLLKKFCSWCIASAILCTIIAIGSISATSIPFIDILKEYSRVILTIHIVGLALGVGGATVSDIFFFKFLRDFRISKEESDVLSVLSQTIWFAIGLLVISGIGLYLPNAGVLNETPKFLVKVIAVAVIIVNGAMLNLVVAPQLIKISFRKEHRHEEGELHVVRRLAYALGAVSITSWYTTVFLGMTPRSVSLDFGALLLGYGAVLLVAVVISQLIDHYMSNSGVGE